MTGEWIAEERADYRRVLIRTWDEHLPMWTVIGLNPSTAEGRPDGKDDNSTRQINFFVKRDGGGGYYLVNLYPRRATKPADLFRMTEQERLGLWPDDSIESCANRTVYQHGRVVAAWGANPKARDRARHVCRMLKELQYPLWCWGANADHSPKHPLYLPHSTELVRWP